MGVIVLAIKGEGSDMRFNPPPDDVIHAGDHLIAMGDLHGLRQLERLAVGARMKITTAAEMREIDRVTTEKYGVPSLTLMENAGTGVADFILRALSRSATHHRRVRQGQQWRRWICGRAQAARRGTCRRGDSACPAPTS